MTKENKSRLIKFLWKLASAVLAAIGTALGVSCAVMAWNRRHYQTAFSGANNNEEMRKMAEIILNHSAIFFYFLAPKKYCPFLRVILPKRMA